MGLVKKVHTSPTALVEQPALKTEPTDDRRSEALDISTQGGPVSAKGDRPAIIDPLTSLPPVTSLPPGEVPKGQGVLQGLWGGVTDFLKGSSATRETHRSKKLLTQVNALAPKLEAMSDVELKAQTDKFRDTIRAKTKPQFEAFEAAREAFDAASPDARPTAKEAFDNAWQALAKAEKKVLDTILPEVFATVREGSARATGMRHYDVQVQAAALMHAGLISEMYTGEGKTLAATLAAYLGALPGHGMHVVTVNDYLSKRDAEEMSAIYTSLGLDVAVLQANGQQVKIEPGGETKEISRGQAYQADITYGTASEFGFDYLRDNGVNLGQLPVQRPLYSVLLDEIDSLLVDEARTPLIIADTSEPPDEASIIQARDIIDTLDLKEDAEWNMEEHWAALTVSGIRKVQSALGIQDLYATGDAPERAAINQNTRYVIQNALKAKVLMRKDEHYTVIDGEVRTVGQSGHAYEGRRFVEGLHQAIEAKEDLEIQPENRTRAAITMRDFLGMYQNRGGMTGTALSASSLFKQVYDLDVARVPTRKPLIRVDVPDKVFATEREKLDTFVQDLVAVHKTGRPVLVGLEFTSAAEDLAEQLRTHPDLREANIQVLGAQSDLEEARIIANAGRRGAITVATTRGGRGVDIKLGGSVKQLSEKLMIERDLPESDAIAEANEYVTKERAEVLKLGGLCVMSYEHLDSRRRDDQLRGRAGRQGDPGTTIFYSSFEDPLYDGMEAVEKIREGKTEFDSKKAHALTEAALDRSEALVDSALIQSLPFDNVDATMRRRFYDLRQQMLAVEELRPVVRSIIDDGIEDLFGELEISPTEVLGETNAERLYQSLTRVLPLPEGPPPAKWADTNWETIRPDIEMNVEKLVQLRDDEAGSEELARLIEKETLLNVMDLNWVDFLEEQKSLRGSIGFRAIAQKDPKLEYVLESAKAYDLLIREIRVQLAAEILTKKLVLNPPAAAD